jgi:hypothetical protein
MARRGDVEKAQVMAKAWQKHMVRGATNQEQISSVSAYAQSIQPQYSMMNQEMQEARGGFSYNAPSSGAGDRGGFRGGSRGGMQSYQRRGDVSSHEVYSNAKMNKK